ncbi:MULTISPECIES: carbohydrate ABC transporter permease [Saccharothrix]|uniref:carbohydrate ABC transporter permease n=1 Tax=Saccharothrix TaxID=2071 RepID=UPI00093BF87E|nr:carbohydrate ABC transporter permease [Saccharothrix sp. CB00851]OKI28633.1 sugar ABC transporter permease [Saccharothrix sp. CB00851]
MTRFKTLPAHVVLVAASAYFVLPLLWLAISATKGRDELFTTFGFALPENFALLDNIRQTLSYEDGIYLRWTANTLLYAGGGALGATALAAMAGYALAKYSFRGSGAISWVIIGAVLVPVTALALPLYFLMSAVGLQNTPWAVLLPSLVSPMGVYLCRLYAISSVPDEVLEAARMDGASEWRVFRAVVLRIMSPILVTVFLFQFVAIWNNFFLPLVMLNSRELFPLTLGLQDWNTQPQVGNQVIFNLVVTGAFLAVVPLVVCFLLLQRHWRQGLAQGSVVA